MSTGSPRWIPPMGFGGTVVSFGAPAIVLYVTTRLAIPNVTQSLGLPPVVWFMTFGAFYVLAPLVAIALMRLRGEALEEVAIWRERLRFRPLTPADWKFALGALVVAVALSFALSVVLRALDVPQVVPSFLANSGDQALTPRDLLLAWAAFGVVSVLTQEILWRGVYLPRQAQTLGATAWQLNAFGWVLFNMPLGWNLLLVLLPVLIAVPFVAQRRGNAMAGAVVHAGAWVVLLLQQQL